MTERRKSCVRCNEAFADYEDMVYTGHEEYWHFKCFVCAQCFKPFNKNLEYYQFGGRNYCEHDYQTLFAHCCSKCHQYITGRFIRAMNNTWHPNCFNCHICQCSLTDQGFVRNNGRALCHDCNISEKLATTNRYVCQKCKDFIDEEPLKIKGDPYHAYHFNCHNCGIELRSDARTLDGDLYCIKCHDKMGIPICGACRKPIEERVVTALGRHYHIDHFACTKCEKPFLGKKHYEWKGLAYCEEHYHHLFGHHCIVCNQLIKGDVIRALNKSWCMEHFACTFCGVKLIVNKTKFHDVDSRPSCKKCYKKLPREIRKRLEKQHRLERKEQKEQKIDEKSIIYN